MHQNFFFIVNGRIVMRLWIFVILSIMITGCGTVSPRTEREIALMRTEILDLEDQYSELSSRHRRALTDLAACKGEPISDYLPELDGAYYPEGQIIGNGVIHTGTPDCCADCSSVYYGEIIDNGRASSSVLDGQQPLILEPQPASQPPTIDPINQPFGEGDSKATDPNIDNDTTRSNLPREHRYLSDRSTSASQWTASPNVRDTEIPNAEPAFRPDTQWTQRARHRLPGEPQDSMELNIELDPNSATSPAWRKTAAVSEPISSGPLDQRFLDEEMASMGLQARVEQIFINPDNTFGKDYDRDGGDDGLQLLIQPLDSQGRIVNRAANLVVSVIDANEVGEAQRIGLWKLESYQVESFVSNHPNSKGLLLDLPWQRRVPAHRNLVVFVRYIGADGQKLETSLDITINPPTQSGEFQMLDSVADRTSNPAEKTAHSNQKSDAPEWRPVR